MPSMRSWAEGRRERASCGFEELWRIRRFGDGVVLVGVEDKGERPGGEDGLGTGSAMTTGDL